MSEPTLSPVNEHPVSAHQADSEEARKAELEAYEASVASLKDYDPRKVPDHEKVVELPDHRSVRVKDLANDETVPADVRNDAKAVVDGAQSSAPDRPTAGPRAPAPASNE